MPTTDRDRNDIYIRRKGVTHLIPVIRFEDEGVEASLLSSQGVLPRQGLDGRVYLGEGVVVALGRRTELVVSGGKLQPLQRELLLKHVDGVVGLVNVQGVVVNVTCILVGE